MDAVKNSTPLTGKAMKTNKVMSVESGEGNATMPKILSKYNIILLISIIAFIAGFSFWIYVNYLL